MMITFRCDSSVNVTYLGDVAVQLLQLMGHSGTVPGALLSTEVASTRRKLQKAVDEARSHPKNSPQVSLVNRALPLLALLESAEQNNCNVLWD